MDGRAQAAIKHISGQNKRQMRATDSLLKQFFSSSILVDTQEGGRPLTWLMGF